jgi:ABC-2 type transport system permease protein
LINPLRYTIDFVERVYLEGTSLEHLTSQLWPLAALATVTLLAASWMFRNRLV